MDQEVIALFEKYLNRRCTREELERVLQTLEKGAHQAEWDAVLSRDAQEIISSEARADMSDEEIASLHERIQNTVREESGKVLVRHPRMRWWPRIAAAASIVIALSAGTWFYLQEMQPQDQLVQQDVPPGGNKAVLTLAGGEQISLSDAVSGRLAEQSGITVSKEDDGQLVYEAKETKSGAGNAPVYNTLSTPMGGQYQVRLPDGTKVWLNAASSLTYPASFASARERRVELSGEAYFEVARNKQQPFRVKTANQEVEVLGTHFNVNSYADEPSEKTTLMEGAVTVTSGSSSKRLNPGQEAAVNGGIRVRATDTEAALAWKNGLFVFDDEPLESIMRKVSRWYDVEIIYQGVDKNELYGGSFSRYENVSGVLKNLEFTGGIHFKIEGRKITAIK